MSLPARRREDSAGARARKSIFKEEGCDLMRSGASQGNERNQDGFVSGCARASPHLSFTFCSLSASFLLFNWKFVGISRLRGILLACLAWKSSGSTQIHDRLGSGSVVVMKVKG